MFEGHELHSSAPSTVLYLPLSQAEQAPAAIPLKKPAVQLEQEVRVLEE